MSTKVIDVAKDFSARPFGRYRNDSEKSAEAFRKDFLVPALNSNDEVVVLLSGSNFYSSSFLEEAFGGLIREEGFTKSKLNEKLKLEHKKLPSLVEEVNMYIDLAEKSRG